MTVTIFVTVPFTAELHAGWNTLLKSGPDKLVSTTLVAAASGCVIGLVALSFAPMIESAAVPYLVASAMIHVG
jgi:hypothetical protein